MLLKMEAGRLQQGAYVFTWQIANGRWHRLQETVLTHEPGCEPGAKADSVGLLNEAEIAPAGFEFAFLGGEAATAAVQKADVFFVRPGAASRGVFGALVRGRPTDPFRAMKLWLGPEGSGGELELKEGFLAIGQKGPVATTNGFSSARARRCHSAESLSWSSKPMSRKHSDRRRKLPRRERPAAGAVPGFSTCCARRCGGR